MSDLMTYLGNSANWATVSPRFCPCKGTGWMLSDRDVFFQCRVHGVGVPHPEDDSMPYAQEKEILLSNLRELWKDLWRESQSYKVGNLMQAIRATGAAPSDPTEWVEAAEELLVPYRMDQAEAQAHAQGYGSAMELREAEQYQREQEERARRR